MGVSGLPAKAGYVENGRLYEKMEPSIFFILNRVYHPGLLVQRSYCNRRRNPYNICR
jgi:hypothetical protein